MINNDLSFKLTRQDIENLSRPFPENVIGVKVQSLSKAKDKALLVLYVQHTDVYERLEQIDPAWSCVMTKSEKAGDAYFVTVSMTLKGVTRENVGEGNDLKGAFSDALKRVAMLFGVGRYLYDQGMVWVPYNEATMKFKQWTYAEYKANHKGPIKHEAPKEPTKPVTVSINEPKFDPPKKELPNLAPKTPQLSALDQKIQEQRKTTSGSNVKVHKPYP